MRVIVDQNIIVYEERNEIILGNSKKKKLYALDSTGSLIFKVIQEFGCIQAAVDSISEKANIDKMLIKDDIEEFVFKLEKAGVIKVYTYH